MGCRILHDSRDDYACLYCSTTDVAFGPVFMGDKAEGRDAEERAESFLRWLHSSACAWTAFEGHDTLDSRRDPRILTDHGLEAAYTTWLAQEADQWQREAQAETVSE